MGGVKEVEFLQNYSGAAQRVHELENKVGEVKQKAQPHPASALKPMHGSQSSLFYISPVISPLTVLTKTAMTFFPLSKNQI